MKHISPLDGNYTNFLQYETKYGGSKNINFSQLNKTLAANRIFSKDDIKWYDRVSKYGYIDPYNTEQVTREVLFFTKPDLNLFSGTGFDSDLNPYLAAIPFFSEANLRQKEALRQLQYSVKDVTGVNNPFMYLLTNSVKSKLDLPGISAESRESTANIMGTSIQYRGHSYKSDNGYDFSLSFTDTAYLEIYTLLKVYDEYMRLLKTGEIAPIKKYILSRIISEQFSIYKFLIGSDGETILFYAKLTGCYFADVPRSDFSDPDADGFKFSVSFHSQFVEDNNPMILEEFNRISPGAINTDYDQVYNYDINAVNNTWARWPKIISVSRDSDLQVARRGTHHDYRLKWIS